MATSSNDSILALGTTAIVVPVGLTLGVLVTPVAGQNSVLLKYQTGGTLWLVGAAQGATLTAAELAAATGHYLVGTSEVLNIDGGARFYLAATAATTTVNVIRGLT